MEGKPPTCYVYGQKGRHTGKRCPLIIQQEILMEDGGEEEFPKILPPEIVTEGEDSEHETTNVRQERRKKTQKNKRYTKWNRLK